MEEEKMREVLEERVRLKVSIIGVGNAGNQLRGFRRYVQQCQAVAERCAYGNQDQHDGQGFNTFIQAFPDALPVHSLINKDRNQQGIDDSDRRGFGCGKHAANHANHHDQHRQERPDGLAQLFDEIHGGEAFSLGIMPLHSQNVGSDHQRQRQQGAGQVTRHKQGAD